MILLDTRPNKGHVVVNGNTFYLTTLPSGRTQHRCPSCGCNINPSAHIPDSDDCNRARDERNVSRGE